MLNAGTFRGEKEDHAVETFGSVLLEDLVIVDACERASWAMGRTTRASLTGQQWKPMLHPDAVNALSLARDRARRSPGAWTEVGPTQVAFPAGGWVRVTGRLRARPDGRDEWEVRRDTRSELIEGWDAIAWWLGVSERTARRWATENVDPMPVQRAANGRISIPLPILQGWRDRRELALLRGWDAIAAHLGVSERTARRWHKQGLPVERRGGRWVGRPGALVAWRDGRHR